MTPAQADMIDHHLQPCDQAASSGPAGSSGLGAMLTGVVYAIAAAQLMKMIYVSSVHQATNTAEIDSASSFYLT